MDVGAAGVKARYPSDVLLFAALVGIPQPAPEEPRPLAPAEHPWSDRSGALVSAGVSVLSSSTWTLGLGRVRAGMHEYGLEWAVEGGAGAAFETGELALDLAIAPGGRIPTGGRVSLPVRGSAGVMSVADDASFVLGFAAGAEIALDRVWRIEAILECRGATGFEDSDLVPFFGVGAGVVAIP